MITIAHVLIGGAVGVATNNPALALFAGVASHLVADAIPHYDSPPNAKRTAEGNIIWTSTVYVYAFFDVGIGLVTALLVGHGFWQTAHFWPFALGAFGGFLPDLIDNVPFWRSIRKLPGFKQFHYFHEEILHGWWEDRFSMRRFAVLGVMTQLTAITVSILTLKSYL